MLKIGEFSKIAQVSIKALRYYDELGLLKPAHIDRFTGYRYYDLTQLYQLNRILALKDLDFSLDQIKEIIKTDLSSQSLKQMLKSKLAELNQRIDSEQAKLNRVECRLEQLQREDRPTPTPVILKSSPELQIASIRQVLSQVDQLQEWRRETLIIIHHYLSQFTKLMVGPDILIYHQDEFNDENLDVESGTVIQAVNHQNIIMPVGDNMQIRTVAASEQLATSLFSPTRYSPSEVYTTLTEWTQLNGFRPIGPWRELTYQQGDPNAVEVIEVQRPVISIKNYYSNMEKTIMEPKIVTKQSFTLVGLRYFGKNEKQEISQLWNEYNQHVRKYGCIKNETGDAALGLCITPEDAPADGSFEYVAGVPVSQVEDIPEKFVVREVPEYTYAVFSHKGDLSGLAKTYEYIYETWLPQSGYQQAAKLDFEYYDRDFKNFAPDSIFYIYVPIRKG